MGAEHTPGRWYTNGDGIVRHSGSGGVFGVKLGSPWIEGAWERENADPETLANARLIASAPDLLEALVYAREQLEAYEHDASGETYNNLKINAAIARATGEAA